MNFFLYSKDRLFMKNILDLRVEEMITQPEYFNEIISFAKTYEKAVRAEEADIEVLNKNALFNCIGFVESVRYLEQVNENYDKY